MDFDDAIKVHASWKLRLMLLVQGAGTEQIPDPSTIARDDACELGKWIHGEVRRAHDVDADFNELRRVHAEFHLATADLVRRILGGAKLSQEEIDASKYARCSQQVIVVLQAMRRRFAR
jgi:hypothetical protein